MRPSVSTVNHENVDAASRRVQAARDRFYIYFQRRRGVSSRSSGQRPLLHLFSET